MEPLILALVAGGVLAFLLCGFSHQRMKKRVRDTMPMTQTVPVVIFALKLRQKFGNVYARVERENKSRSGRFHK